MSTSHSSTCVYVKDDQHGWLPANVLSYNADNTTARVSVTVPSGSTSTSATTTEEREVTLSDYDSSALPLQNINEGGNLITMADMCDLPSLHEPAILYNLRNRHHNLQPYTRVGDIIIAMNPFQWIDGLYSDNVREEYVDRLVWRDGAAGACGDASSHGARDDPKAGLAPHVYETSSLAYRGLAVDDSHQSILVTGESGAGKTETVKIIMSHLASIQSTGAITEDQGTLPRPEPAEEHISHNPRDNCVVRRVLDSNPLLEAFGNAKTVRNDNSSRFGKYIQLQFDVEDSTEAAYKGKTVPSCLLAGSYCETYLLEKSRVVGHEEAERTYHIFYQLLAAPQDVKAGIWDGLMGATTESFRYVGGGSGNGDAGADTLIEGRTDGEKWENTVDALETIGIVGDKLRTLMRSICVVLQLGNLEFGADPNNDDASVITNADELSKLASLMGIDAEAIAKALTFRTITAGGRGKESYTVPLRPASAKDSCDAFAKEIYARSFDWLVRTINEATCAEQNYDDAADVQEFGVIGLLDIFGFEAFQVNRFEQLCINYANEKLQQKYTLDVFSSVQEEYEYEGIALGDISYSDNAEVLRLIEGRMGLIAVLNEECVRPNGNDTSFVSKVKTVNKDTASLIDERLHRPTEFAICHYAGPVKYDATNFVTKNTDTLAKDLIECAATSDNELIAQELQNSVKAKAEQAAAAAPTLGRGRSGAVTVSANFRSQLTSLMHNIGKTKTRYVRCIKPNPEKKPIEVDLLSSTEQLRCAGVVAAVNVSRAAFPNRLMHRTALERFSCLSSESSAEYDEKEVDESQEEKKEDASVVDNNTSQHRDAVEALLGNVLKDMEAVGDDGTVAKAFAVGKSRVYFRAGALEHLETARLDALGVYAIVIERAARGFLARSKFLRHKDAATVIQSSARRLIARSKFQKDRCAATAISCWVRCINAKNELVRLRRERACTLLQTRYRIFVAVRHFDSCRSSAITIQKIARGSRQRPIYRAALQEAKEEAVVNKKIAALQKRLADAEMKLLKANGGAVQVVPPEAVPTYADAEEKDEDAQEVRQRAHTIDKELMDDSMEMINVLKKEVFELRSKNYLLRSDFDELKLSYQDLSSQYASVSLSYEALKQTNSEITKANKDMIFRATRDKKEFFDTKRQLTNENDQMRGELARLRSKLEAKERAGDAELARLRAENDRLKAKQGGHVSWASSTPPPSAPAMRRAEFNTRTATFNRGIISPEGSDNEEWKVVTPKGKSESRNPQASSGGRRRPRGTRGGRRDKGRSPGAQGRRKRTDREPSSPNGGRYTPSTARRPSTASTGYTGSSKGMPRVTSTTSLSEVTKGSRSTVTPKKKSTPSKNIVTPKGVEASISSSTTTPTSAPKPAKKAASSSLALAASKGRSS